MYKQPGTHTPVLILLDGKEGQDSYILKQWCDNNLFRTYEASDAFDVIEKLCDFTGNRAPQVIFLEVDSLSEEYGKIQKFVHDSGDPAGEMPIFTLSESREYPNSFSTSGQLRTELGKVLPRDRRKALRRKATRTIL